jgi:pimeloyl-ACP methyl ester carboxylesterase
MGRIFAVLLTVAACSPSLAQVGPNRPVIFLPGVTGSKLCDISGTVVWGTANSFRDFAKLALQHDGADQPIRPCGLIEEFQIIGSFLAADQYNNLLNYLSLLGYSREQSLYVFDYDWRISNYDNARLLDRFIRQRIPEGKPFDIIAHSMGGIVARIYMDEYASSKSLDRIIYLGTPFLGSMDTFGVIKEGWGWPWTNRAGGKDVIWRVAVSFPSMLELLPRYEQCCYLSKSDGSRQFLDVFDPDLWRQLGWLPHEFSDAKKFDRFRYSLQRAQRLTNLLTRSAPSRVWELLFAGDTVNTLRRVGMREGATKPSDWVFSKARGDGTVPVWSVARRPKSDTYSNTLPSFAVHAHLFDDKWVMNKIGRSLQNLNPGDPDPIGAPGPPALAVTVNGVASTWSIETADIEVAKPFLRPGMVVQADLTIQFDSGVADLATNVYKPKAILLQSGQKTPLQVRETSQDSDLELRRLRFSAIGNAPGNEGAVEIVFEINETYTPSKAFYVTQMDD